MTFAWIQIRIQLEVGSGFWIRFRFRTESRFFGIWGDPDPQHCSHPQHKFFSHLKKCPVHPLLAPPTPTKNPRIATPAWWPTLTGKRFLSLFSKKRSPCQTSISIYSNLLPICFFVSVNKFKKHTVKRFFNKIFIFWNLECFIPDLAPVFWIVYFSSEFRIRIHRHFIKK